MSKAVAFEENATGYALLFSVIGSAGDALVAMEATGHYWKNLFAELCARGFPVALINPVRTRRFAAEDLQRTKTDAIDAVGIARFAAQKEPAVTRLPEQATEELRELRAARHWVGVRGEDQRRASPWRAAPSDPLLTRSHF